VRGARIGLVGAERAPSDRQCRLAAIAHHSDRAVAVGEVRHAVRAMIGGDPRFGSLPVDLRLDERKT